jgi:hypothetical protein
MLVFVSKGFVRCKPLRVLPGQGYHFERAFCVKLPSVSPRFLGSCLEGESIYSERQGGDCFTSFAMTEPTVIPDRTLSFVGDLLKPQGSNSTVFTKLLALIGGSGYICTPRTSFSPPGGAFCCWEGAGGGPLLQGFRLCEALGRILPLVVLLERAW